ncbi:MAG: T9SS type A sorting domain-containing protein [Bacteroidales bacterium]|nr:T9SS type A sorting domain-containing protein [Bacteroidales bacterium]
MKYFVKILSLIFFSVLFSARVAVSGEPVEFEIFENFDDDSHFTADAIVPDGWVSIGSTPAARSEAGEYVIGYNSYSGSYVLHSSDLMGVERDEVIFTPMMELAGGKDALLSFYIYAPGGSPSATFYSYVDVKVGTNQSIETHTISLGSTNTAFASWTQLSFLYTPVTDGEYCFSISLKQSTDLVRDHGVVGIDDLRISGFEPGEAEPEDVELTIIPAETGIPTITIGETYSTSFNIKATNLVDDIMIQNISTEEINVEDEIIPMTQAMSESGYDLEVNITPSSENSTGGYFELATENLDNPLKVYLTWTTIDGMDELIPNPSNYVTAKEVPYSNTFDNYDDDYDGVSYLPMGWTSEGADPFITANIEGLPAVTGNYYLVAIESMLDHREDRLYTPFFRLSTDFEYVISYYLYMPGNSGGGVLRSTDLTVTVGSEQDINYHPVIKQNIKDQSLSNWTYQEFTFKPLISGAYCFAFSLSTDVNYSGMVAIEDFNITAPGIEVLPTADFAVGGNFNVIDSRMVVYKNQNVHLTNLSTNGEEYSWTVTSPSGLTQFSTEENPSFLLNESGDFNIELTTTNSSGSRTNNRTLAVEYIDYDTQDYTIMTFNPNQDKLLERGSIPAFSANGIEDYDYDYVTGYNRYYNKYAERYEIPDGVKLKLYTISTWLAHYRNRPFTSGYDCEKPFEIVVYGETNGQLDETKVFGRITTTLEVAFGSTGIGSGTGEPRTINIVDFLGDSIEVEGTFYLAFEFSDEMTIATDDPNVGRSYFAINTILHATEKATLFVKPTAVPSNSSVEADGNWYPVDLLDNRMNSVGAYLILWVSNEITDVAINNFGEIVFALYVNNDNLIISGTEANEKVVIYDINGRIVASEVGEQNSTSVNISSLNNGVYIVKTNAGAAKFVK